MNPPDAMHTPRVARPLEDLGTLLEPHWSELTAYTKLKTSHPQRLIYPASYAGLKDTDRKTEEQKAFDKYNLVQRNGTLVATVDSVQSQANRIEPLFKTELAELVPQINIKGKVRTVNLLDLPHRIADATIALSSLEDKVKQVLAAFYKGDALPLAKFAPTSLIFGAWDSRGNAAIKIRRIITSMIKADDVSVNHESAQFDSAAADLYQDEEGEIPAEESQEKTKLSTFGLADAPSCWQRSGVYVNGDIYQFASLNLNLIRTYRTAKPDETHALQRYILGLALAAFFRPQTFDLRAGCTLTRDGEDATKVRLCDSYGKEETVHIGCDHIVAFAKAAAKDFGVGENLEADFLKAKADKVVSSVKKKK
jgi:CRISPR-associated protein Csb1